MFKCNLDVILYFIFSFAFASSFSETTLVFFFILKFPSNSSNRGPPLNSTEWNFLLKIEEKLLPTSAVPALPLDAQLVGVILVTPGV